MKRNHSNHIDIIEKNMRLNSNSTNNYNCYCVCANKYKLTVLKNLEHQIIYGRRGSGKTTILRAFVYLINDIEKSQFIKAFYINLNYCTPTSFKKTYTEEEILLLTIKNILIKLKDFFFKEIENQESQLQYHRLFMIETLGLQNQKINTIINLLSELEDLINTGTPSTNFGAGIKTYSSHSAQKNNFKLGFNFSSQPKVNVGLGIQDSNDDEVTNYYEQTIIYNLDLAKIKNKIIEIIQAFGFEHLYFCMDEFYHIDKDINYSIQSRFAQIIKMLLFDNENITVKIANVWNESRIQSKNLHGIREGLKVPHIVKTIF